jgi:hypothetical protein
MSRTSAQRLGTSDAPAVPVRRRGRQLIVEQCPHCGRRHVHGDGGRRERGWHGHRVAHCRERQAIGYHLVECSEPETIPASQAPLSETRHGRSR